MKWNKAIFMNKIQQDNWITKNKGKYNFVYIFNSFNLFIMLK
jgi:hypothetical protein